MSLREILPRLPVLLAASMLLTAPLRADDQQQIDRAAAIWQLLASEHFKEFVATGDETMKSAFNAQQAEQLWSMLRFQLGKYERVESATVTRVGQYDSVRFIFRFERGTATMRLVLNQQGQLSGLWSDGVAPNVPYQPPDYVDKNAFHEEKVTVTCGTYELPGTLSLPNEAGAHPAVVLVHGSGPNDEDETVGANKPFRDLAWGLASRGIAVLRYEKRTHKYGEDVKPSDITLDWETIDDALAAVKSLRQRPDIDPARVFVLGHSLGGMAAPFIAARDEKLAGIILLAANARSPLDLVEDQTEYLAKLDGGISDEERQALNELKQAIAAIRSGQLDHSDKPLLGAPASYWASLDKLDPVAEAARLKLPFLIIHGGRDYQVTAADATIWKKRLGERKNVTIKLYDSLNHLMIAGKGPSSPNEYQQAGHVDETLVRDVAAWIHAESGRAAPE